MFLTRLALLDGEELWWPRTLCLRMPRIGAVTWGTIVTGLRRCLCIRIFFVVLAGLDSGGKLSDCVR